MSFSQSSITRVSAFTDGPDLVVSWDSVDPDGTSFQVYVDRRLAWFGTARRCHVPLPTGATARNVWVDVGAVSASETRLDHSASLGSAGRSGNAPVLSWFGGTYLDPSGRDDVGGFQVYRCPAPGQPVDLTTPVATISAYPGGWVSDGYGLGRYGFGGFGRSETRYSWSPGPLPSGLWDFVIRPFDRSGTDRGAGQHVTARVDSAPRPPARSPGGDRLTYEYSGPESRRVTLRWSSSPSAT